MATDNPLSAFFRGFQGAQQATQQRERQAQIDALNEQLKQIQLQTAQQQLLGAQRTPLEIAQEIRNRELAQQSANPFSGVTFNANPAIPNDFFSIDPTIPQQAQAQRNAQDIQKIKDIETFKKSLETPSGPKVEFRQVGNTFRTYQDGIEVSREVIPADNVVRETAAGMFIGNPNDISTFKKIPGTEKPTAAVGGKPPTEAQARAAKFSSDVKQGNQVLDTLFGSGFNPSTVNPLKDPLQTALNVASGVGETLQNIPVVGGLVPSRPNAFSREEKQQFDQASEQIIEGALRFASGANTPPLEKREYRKIYIDQIGDGPAVRAQKKAARDKLIVGLESLAAGQVPKDILDSVVSAQQGSSTPEGQLEITEIVE